MKFIKTEIEDVVIIEPDIFTDERGYFSITFNETELHQHIGNIRFIQDNESSSTYGVLRGLHYQKYPYAQAKLVRVIKGKVLDVAVDIRKDSKTFGKYVAVVLNEENKKQLFVPRGFAHGFVVLSDDAIFNYKVDNCYSKESEASIRFDDPEINIPWENYIDKADILLSDKDKEAPLIKNSILF